MSDYAHLKTVNRPFDEVLESVIDGLEQEGFGVLTEIDVKETLKKKLDVEYDDYRILGACNPDKAYQALGSEKEIGLLLPCNVIVYEDDGATTVGTMRPTTVMGLSDNDELDGLAAEVEESMNNVLDRL